MYKIKQEEAEKIRKAMSAEKNKNAYRRMQAVALRGEGRKNAEISEITGFNHRWVCHLCKVYCAEGIDGLTKDGRKGGNRRNMSEEEAASFLASFEKQAIKGQVITIDDIAEAYDAAVGVKHASLSTVYYLLHNHGWRKVAPKQYHPGRASNEVIDTSKKLTKS
jgi:transposase